MPLGVCANFPATERLTVDSCMPIRSATSFSERGARLPFPVRKNSACASTTASATSRSVFSRWDRHFRSHSAEESFSFKNCRSGSPAAASSDIPL